MVVPKPLTFHEGQSALPIYQEQEMVHCQKWRAFIGVKIFIIVQHRCVETNINNNQFKVQPLFHLYPSSLLPLVTPLSHWISLHSSQSWYLVFFLGHGPNGHQQVTLRCCFKQPRSVSRADIFNLSLTHYILILLHPLPKERRALAIYIDLFPPLFSLNHFPIC